jgi:pentatricopeptide repeat protein
LTSIISAVAAHVEATDVLCLFSEMISSGTRPDTIAFTAVLTACANAGMVSDARIVFDSIQVVFGITLAMEQYACMVSTLSHAGMLKDAVELVNSMPFEPNATVLGALLNGAAEVGNVEPG